MPQKTVSIVCSTVLSIFMLVLGYIGRDDFGVLPVILFIAGIILAIFVAQGIFSHSR